MERIRHNRDFRELSTFRVLLSNLIEFSQMVQLALDKKILEAEKIHYQLLEFIDHLFMDGSPAGVKEALSFMGIVENHVRLPLVPVNKNISEKLKNLVHQIQN